MKQVIKNIIAADFWQWMLFTFGVFVAGILSLIIYSFTVEKRIDCYYNSSYSSNNGYVIHQVKASIDWHGDTVAFQSMDSDEAAKFAKTVNICAAK